MLAGGAQGGSSSTTCFVCLRSVPMPFCFERPPPSRTGSAAGAAAFYEPLETQKKKLFVDVGANSKLSPARCLQGKLKKLCLQKDLVHPLQLCASANAVLGRRCRASKTGLTPIASREPKNGALHSSSSPQQLQLHGVLCKRTATAAISLLHKGGTARTAPASSTAGFCFKTVASGAAKRGPRKWAALARRCPVRDGGWRALRFRGRPFPCHHLAGAGMCVQGRGGQPKEDA
jgi:hypothetical protein